MTNNTEQKLSPLNDLSQDEEGFRHDVRKFSEQKIRPLVKKMDEDGVVQPAIMDGLFAQGLMGIRVPKQYGGLGGSFLKTALAIEEIARVDPAIAIYVHVQNSLVVNVFLAAANSLQKQRYIPLLATDTIASFAVSEANAGSDAFSMVTHAQSDGNNYILNGRKLWISGAAEAGLFVVFAKTTIPNRPDGTSAFIVELSTPGFVVGKKDDKLGVRACSTCELILVDVRVPAENVLGNIGDGNKLAVETLNEGRVGIAAQMLGLADGAFQAALTYAQIRKQFGQVIANFQAVNFRLAEMATDVAAARLMVYNAARVIDGSSSPLERFKTSAMAKYFASHVAERVASQAVEILGGYGYTKDSATEKYYRDAKVGKIYEGTTNMLLRTIATTLLQNQQGSQAPLV